MSDHLPVLKVRLFGGFSASYGEIPVSFGRNTTTKAMKLLQILLYHGDTGISRDKLLDELYGREELADAANNLRVTAHRLKKIIVDAGLPSHDYINIKKGIYRWDAPMPTEVDAHQFKVLSKDVQTCTDKVKKLALLKKICLMYRGEFLPELSGDEWVLVESVQYKNIYSESLQELCKLLIERGDYEETLRFCEPACQLYPFDEWQSVRIDCYMALNRYKDAVQEYENTAKLFFEELGIRPSEHMMQQCLRKGDSFTKYSPSQFLILLVGTNKENCSMIFDRIQRYFSREHKSWKQYLDYFVSSVAEVDRQDSPIQFNTENKTW